MQRIEVVNVDDIVIETAPSQKHQNPILEKLKNSHNDEDKSEIVLDLRDEAFSETYELPESDKQSQH